MNDSAFDSFLKEFIPQVADKENQLSKALWILETTGSEDASRLLATLDNEFKLLFSDEKIYEKLIYFQKNGITDPFLNRQLNILINEFKANMIPKNLLKEISEKEASLALTYANFRTQIDGKVFTENEIRDILKQEKDVELRKKAWDASKDVGITLADKIVYLAKLRNKVANHLGYDNYFDMMLDLNEINKDMLFETFNDLKVQTDESFVKMINEVNETLANEYNVGIEDLGPWAWKDPFCQKDPIEHTKIFKIFENLDILEIARSFYDKMGFCIEDLIKRSDLYEREGKNQHAFCIDMDRKGDVRTLNNIKPNAQWMETLLHEFGHGVYYQCIDSKLPWLLRTVSHTITTEALAILMGRQVSTKEFLQDFCACEDEQLLNDIEKGTKREQLVFSRSAFLITEFEKCFYEDPDQDLNNLWWDLFEKYYSIKRPENREGKQDWAAKYHIGLAPVYYHCYLLGEVFASTLHNQLLQVAKDDKIWKKPAGKFLEEKLFLPGNKYRWDYLIEYITQKPLSSDAWVSECNR
ncbi:MAG: M3 family oligoendopeptidase [Parachlamydiales bacterium]|nr:M3 family oligoendopeptidase [Parachlamydiales bacterium]